MKHPTVQITPHLLLDEAGQSIQAEWGYLWVPENRRADTTRQVSIPFIRLPGRTKKSPALVYLQGGPGFSILSHIARVFSLPVLRPPTHLGDVIYLEQRGYGLSRPNLRSPGAYAIPFDKPGSPALYQEAMHTYLSRAYEYWLGTDIDLSGYNVLEMAADIDDLRRTLGYEKISISGGSFGSHHGLAILNHYGEHIHRAYLSNIEGPNHSMKLPANIQRDLEGLAERLKKEGLNNQNPPDLIELIEEVFKQFEGNDIRGNGLDPDTGKEQPVRLGLFDLQLVIANGLGNSRFLSRLPARMMQIADGDYIWLATQVIRERSNQDPSLMYALVDFASGATRERRAQIRTEAATTLLGDVINDPFMDFTDLFANYDLGDEFRTEFSSKVRTMLVSGGLDFRTPASNAADLADGLPNHQQILVEGASHDLTWRGDHLQDLAAARDDFLLGGSPSRTRLNAGFKFVSVEELQAEED